MKYLREITCERVGLNEHTPHQVTGYVGKQWIDIFVLTNWITSFPYLKTYTTSEVCTPQIEQSTYRRGGIHNCIQFGPLTTGRHGYHRGSLTCIQTV